MIEFFLLITCAWFIICIFSKNPKSQPTNVTKYVHTEHTTIKDHNNQNSDGYILPEWRFNSKKVAIKNDNKLSKTENDIDNKKIVEKIDVLEAKIREFESKPTVEQITADIQQRIKEEYEPKLKNAISASMNLSDTDELIFQVTNKIQDWIHNEYAPVIEKCVKEKYEQSIKDHIIEEQSAEENEKLVEQSIQETIKIDEQDDFNNEVPSIEKYELYLNSLRNDSYLNQKQKQQKRFYLKFKKNFLNDIYLQLNGNYYYAELLLEDICGELLQNMQDIFSKNKLRKYIKNIATYYGESIYVLRYCDYFNDKIGITINGNEYHYFSDYSVTSGYFKLFLQKNINITAVKPILDWIYDSNNFYCRNMRILINQDKTIDCIKMEYSNKDTTCCKVTLINDVFPDYIQFGKVECDFIILNEKKKGDNVICYKHDIKSLRGCPTYVDGNFVCAKLGLTSLEYCPIKVNGNLNASRNKISLFTSVNVGGVLDLTYNKINNESIETIKNDNNIIVNASHIDVDHNDLPKYTAKYFHR